MEWIDVKFRNCLKSVYDSIVNHADIYVYAPGISFVH